MTERAGNDKVTIGLTESGSAVMERLMETPYFNDQLHAAKFAMALAIREHEQPRAIAKTKTVWNFGSFDPDGRLKQLVPLLVPGCEEPYRAIESLIDIGLTRLGELMSLGPLDISGLIRADDVPLAS